MGRKEEIYRKMKREEKVEKRVGIFEMKFCVLGWRRRERARHLSLKAGPVQITYFCPSCPHLSSSMIGIGVSWWLICRSRVYVKERKEGRENGVGEGASSAGGQS